uniref:MAK10-like protein n=1 Tax=Tanacetum cinerariifolium TaxID=118510 RepID=A0A699GKH1_TANCI|nr:MAK10-like protein [Tanacetum cinerariifolium]
MVPLRSDTIRLVQNGCLFRGLRSKDPNQYLKDFLKLLDSIDLDGENRERTRLHLFQFSLRDQASNRLERLPAGSITTWEDLTTPWTHFKDLLQKVHHHGIDHWLQIQIFYDHISFHLKCKIDSAGGGKLRNKNADESWKIIENLPLYDHECWNDTNVFAKPVKAIFTPQGTSKTPDRILLELEDQINFLLKGSRPAPKKVLIREEAKSPITKSVNSISLIKEDEEKNDIYDVAPSDDSKEIDGPDMEVSVKEAETKNEAESMAKNKPIKNLRKKQGSVYEAILQKKITKKEDVEVNFEIPWSIGGLKHVNALVNQGSDVNVMPYSTYVKLTNERPVETDIRLSLASHSHKGRRKETFILGTPFLTMAKAVINFDKGTITLRSGKSKISFYRIPESPGTIKRGVKNNIEPIAPTMTVNKLVLEEEERIRLYQEWEIEFDR